MQKDFDDFYAQMTRVDIAPTGDGGIERTVLSMTDEAAVAAAERIVQLNRWIRELDAEDA